MASPHGIWVCTMSGALNVQEMNKVVTFTWVHFQRHKNMFENSNLQYKITSLVSLPVRLHISFPLNPLETGPHYCQLPDVNTNCATISLIKRKIQH